MGYQVTIYNKITGEIKSIISGSDKAILSAQDIPVNSLIYDGVAGDTQYINPTTKMPKERLFHVITADIMDILDDGISGARLTLPDPCFIAIRGKVQEVIGGNFVFKSSVSGILSLKLVGKYTGQIQITVHDIVNLKEQVKGQLTARYGQALSGGFTYNGNIYDSDETSMNLISGAASEAGRNPLPQGFAWKTQNNQFVPMATADIEGLSAALFAHINTVFAIKETKKVALAALSSLQDVLNFDVIGGW